MTRSALVLVGFYVAALGAVLHRQVASPAGIELPWGLVLAVAVIVPVALAADAWVRLGSAWVAIGWALLLMVQGYAPGGGQWVAGDALGWSFSLGGLGVLVCLVVFVPRLNR